MNYKSRLVVVENIYYARGKGDDFQLSPSYNKFLQSDEQAYGPREVRATTEWTRVESWIKQASVVSIINTESRDGLTEEGIEQKTLEVSCSSDPNPDDIWILSPGDSMRGRPKNLSNLKVRSRVGTVELTISIIPV